MDGTKILENLVRIWCNQKGVTVTIKVEKKPA